MCSSDLSSKIRRDRSLSPTSSRSLGALSKVLFPDSDDSEQPGHKATENQQVKAERHESRARFPRVARSVFWYLNHYHLPGRLQELYELRRNRVELCQFCFAHLHQVTNDHRPSHCQFRPLFGYKKEGYDHKRRKVKRRDDSVWLENQPVRTGTPRGRWRRRAFNRWNKLSTELARGSVIHDPAGLMQQQQQFGPQPDQQFSSFNANSMLFGQQQHFLPASHHVQIPQQPQFGVGQSLPRQFASPSVPHQQQQTAFYDCSGFGQQQRFGSLPQGQKFSTFNPQQPSNPASYHAQIPQQYQQNTFSLGPSLPQPFGRSSAQYDLQQQFIPSGLTNDLGHSNDDNDQFVNEVSRRLSLQNPLVFNSCSGSVPK